MDINDIQDKIKKVKSLALYEPSELKYLNNSVVAKTMYDQGRVPNTPRRTNEDEDEEDEEVPYWRQRVTCNVCGKTHARSAVSKHKKSNYHKMHEKVNAKLREFILE